MIDFVVGLFHRLMQAGSILYWLLSAIAVVLLVLAVAAMVRGTILFVRHLFQRMIGAISSATDAISSATDAAWRALADSGENILRATVGIVVNLLVHEYGRPSVKVMFRATVEDAERAMRNRMDFLQRIVRTSSAADVEAPPGLRAPPPRAESFDSAGAAAARLTRNAWEISHPSLMLHGRARDAVACIVWHGHEAGVAYEMPNFYVGIRPLRWWEARAGEYPWIVEIGTDQPAFFREKLRPLQSWLGVSVGLTAPLAVRLQRGCRESCVGVADGTIACTVSADRDRYLMTCAHVTPPSCCAEKVRGDFLHGDEPDVLLLRAGQGCSATKEDGKALRPADHALIDDLINTRHPVSRVGGRSRRRTGRVHYANMSYSIGEIIFRFPACVVRVRRLWYFWVIPWPIIGWRFSKAGDSGSMVTCPSAEDGADWIGMIHAGEKADSLVLLATPLMAYLRERLAIDKGSLQAQTL